MGKHRKAPPEVNAGSMADIAFLLLIFFLVTTTIQVDQGINRKLPPIDDKQETPPEIKEKNIFIVNVNRNNQLLVDNELMEINGLRAAAVAFLDNGGDGSCAYCKGPKDPESSDNPEKAIISITNDADTKYETYIAVQNELVAAYYELRDKVCLQKYGKTYRELEAMYDDPRTKEETRERIEPLIKDIQEMYPQKLSEAEPKKS